MSTPEQLDFVAGARTPAEEARRYLRRFRAFEGVPALAVGIAFGLEAGALALHPPLLALPNFFLFGLIGLIGIRELASWAHRKRYAGAGVLPQSWTLPDEAAPHAASYAKWHEGLTRFSYWTWIAGAVLRSGKGSLGSYLVMAGLALYAAKMLHDYVRLGLWEDLLLFVGFGGGLLYLYLRVATFPQLLLFLGGWGAAFFVSGVCLHLRWRRMAYAFLAGENEEEPAG